MADKKISELTPADTLDGTEIVGLVQSGSNRRSTTADIAAIGLGYMQYVSISASRDLAASDHGKMLLVTGDVVLSAPPGLPAGFWCNILNIGSGVVVVEAGAGASLYPSDVTLDNTLSDAYSAATIFHVSDDEFEILAGQAQIEAFTVALGDETSDVSVGDAKVTFRLPYDVRLVDVRASVSAAPTGAAMVFDINQNGVTVLSTALSIDAGDRTSVGAATPPVIDVADLNDDDEITVDVTQVGSTVPGAGPKITFFWYRRAATILGM